ncbi:TonB-dependent receptor [Sphingobium phenoxybenzoativorans]|uniref:TonB-dependent receptor n=1 Tax=Sphingobium phenoxybenzoativorans TaxID=1592790 RepID=A0A975Q1U3_9SPHN|nr:TonB-dependent receptor [Sphingobium phenoxybenzoativorans]QUT05743.1 TonB-dependent receptor [Sphingobium phenoxybenzoativorans]
MLLKQRLLTTTAGALMVMGFHGAVHAQTSVPAGEAAATTDEADIADIVVTGSRVATNGNASPTPLTVVTTQALLAQTPSNIPDALNKLPQFQPGRSGQAGPGSAGGNSGANTLNLRNFGAQRNLILFNGLRVPATTAAGEVDINVLPQMLIQRVDVVTGGTSAVYGSDAVTGVVNFVVDKTFTGIKFNAQAGISSRNDNEQWKFGVAAGTYLFGDDRAHIEFSYEHFDSKGIGSLLDRKAGKDVWTATGSGTPANPFMLTRNGRASIYTNGGLITVGPPSLVGRTFSSNGVLTPFASGLPTGSNGLQSGGDGLFFNEIQLYAPLVTDQAYGRFDYEFSDALTAYADVSFSQSKSHNGFLPFGTNGLPGANGLSGAVILSGNAFLPESVQTALTASGAPSFVLSKYESGDSAVPGAGNRNRTRNWLATAGLEGKIFERFNWNASVRYGRTSQHVINTNNINASKFAAALDAVVNPATGRVVCQVSLTPFASLYPGCVPVNLFGPSAVTPTVADYITDDTSQTLINEQTIFNAGISGEVFSTWAGPVRMSVSGEYRDINTKQISTTNPLNRASCTGLRVNCLPTTPAYFGYTNGPFSAQQTVKEAAVEVLVPLLADVPFIRKLEFNGAARYTDYSTSGSVKTWKVGLSWAVSNELRFRATRSRDIRAPNLYDLYRPGSESLFGFADLHTGVTKTVAARSQGNPALVPEIGKTLTVGAVYKPDWFSGFSISLDYYDIKLSKAITTVAGTSAAIQRLCEDSNGTSPYCALYIRPFPFSDRSPANTATAVLSQSLNVATLSTKGLDIEANYSFSADKLFSSAGGRFDLRFLGSYQPKLLTQQMAGGIITNGAGVNGVSKLRLNLMLAYNADSWGMTINQRWKSKQQAFSAPIVFQIPDASAYAYTDVTLEYKPKLISEDTTLFFTVQNLFDKQPPVFGGPAGAPGLTPSYAVGYDVVGRYFTAGIRAKL